MCVKRARKKRKKKGGGRSFSHTATMFLQTAQSDQTSFKGSSDAQLLHVPSMMRCSYRGPKNRRPVRSSASQASTTPGGQYPIKFHGECLREMEERERMMSVTSEHNEVERDTERILARMAADESRGRPAAALVVEDA